MARRKNNRVPGVSQPQDKWDAPDSLSGAAIRTVWNFPRRVRVFALSISLVVAAIFALWTSLPDSSKTGVLSHLGLESTPTSSSPETEPLVSRELSIAETSVRQPTLLPPQGRLLELLVKYQQRFAASKLVVSRTDGRLFCDDDPQRGADVSLIRDLYGVVDLRNAGRFEELMQNMPSEYVRLSGEARLDNPFVISVTEAGVKYVETRR